MAASGAGPDARVTHIPQLDGLRGVACLLVLGAHAAVMGWPTGALGVYVFFALSGFLITRILLAQPHGAGAFKTFYLRRASRIFPLYFVALLAVAPFYHGHDWRLGWIYLANFETAHEVTPVSHIWSLCVEEHYYLVWPFLVLCMSRRRSRALVLVLLVLSVPLAAAFEVWLVKWGMSLSAVTTLVYRSTPCQLLPIIAGSAAAYFEPRLKGWVPLALAAGVWSLHWIQADVVAITATWLFNGAAPNVSSQTGIQLTGIAVFLLGLWEGWLPLTALLRDRVMGWVGKISYGLYVIHFPIFVLTGFFYAGRWSTTLIAFAAVFVTAAVSYRFFERPIMDAVRRPRRKAGVSLGSGSGAAALGGDLPQAQAEKS